MIIKNNINWYPWQEDIIKGIITHPTDSIHVIKSSRQKGKSVMCESIILWYACNSNTYNIYLTPTLKQARKVFKEITKAIQETSIFLKANESLLEIRLNNGSVIQFCSAEQGDAGLRGYTVTGVLIIDEAAYIPDDIYYAITPTTDANNCNTIIVSTPKYKNGFFYELYMDGINNIPNVYSYDFSSYDTSILLPQEKLDYYKKILPESKFIQDYLGEFTDIGAGIFGNFTNALYDKPIYNGDPTVAGVDWGSGTHSDDTSICIFNMKKEMVDIVYFNDLDEVKTIDYISDLVLKYNIHKLQVETNSIGQIFYSMLKKKIYGQYNNVEIKGFNTNNTSKQRIVQKLQVAIQNNEVKLINDNKLVSQLGDFESKLTSVGKVTYAAGGNRHDDLVMATLLAFDLTKIATYSII